MRKRMKKGIKILIALLVFLGVVIIGFALYYSNQITPVNRDNESLIEVNIESGTSSSVIGDILYDNGLIKNTLIYNIHIRLTGVSGLQAGTYQLSPSMSLDEILSILEKGIVIGDSQLITFKEGWTLSRIGEELEKYTLITEESFLAKMNDLEYINFLIEEYWFLDEVILDEDIYYPLEGYLFPETYAISDDVVEEDVIEIMLDQMNKVLEDNRDLISKSKFTIHELLTLASIVELEGVGDKDRDQIAEVFYNRLDAGWSLGSDVTTCYGVGASLKDCNDNIDYDAYTPYNTRSVELAGMLPIGPICSPSLKSIAGSISPEEHDYYYFVADKFKNVFFTKTYDEHLNVIAEIKGRGEWPW